MEEAAGGDGGIRDDFADGVFDGEFELAALFIDDSERARGLSDERSVLRDLNRDGFADDVLRPFVLKENRLAVVPSSPSVQIQRRGP